MSFNTFKVSGRHLIAGVAMGAALVAIGGCSANSDGNSGGGGGGGNGAIIQLVANPAQIPTTAANKTSTLTWSHPEASSCTASSTDPSGTTLNSSADFNGSQKTTNGSFTTTALTTVGNYTFKLTCTGGSGTTTDTAFVTVYSGTASSSLVATPSSIPLGASQNTSTLTWNHPEAVSCTASSTDPSGNALSTFSGTVNTTGGNVTTQPQTVLGTYTYNLTCTSAAGAQTKDKATVTVYNANTIDVPLTAVPTSTTQNSTVNLSWNHPNASSCTAAETAPDTSDPGDFIGSKNTTNGQFTTQPLAQVGNYTFKLTCVDQTTNVSKTDTATVTVTSSTPVTADNCSVGLSNSVPFVNTSLSDTTFTTTHKGLIPSVPLLLPNGSDPMTNEANVINSDLSDFGTLTSFVGITGTVSETVNDTGSTNLPYQGGRVAGFVVDFPPELVQAGVLQNVTLSTLKRNSFGDEQVVQSADSTGSAGGGLKVQLLDTSVLGSTGTNKAYLSFTTTAGNNFDAVQLQIGGLLNVVNQINIYYACVADASQ